MTELWQQCEPDNIRMWSEALLTPAMLIDCLFEQVQASNLLPSVPHQCWTLITNTFNLSCQKIHWIAGIVIWPLLQINQFLDLRGSGGCTVMDQYLPHASSVVKNSFWGLTIFSWMWILLSLTTYGKYRDIDSICVCVFWDKTCSKQTARVHIL